MSIFDKEEDFALVRKRMVEIQAQKPWVTPAVEATKPAAEEGRGFTHTSPDKLTGTTPAVEATKPAAKERIRGFIYADDFC